jgi:hypothetical protein
LVSLSFGGIVKERGIKKKEGLKAPPGHSEEPGGKNSGLSLE